MLTQDTTTTRAELAAMQDLRQVETAVALAGRRILTEAAGYDLDDEGREGLAIQLRACGVTLTAAAEAAGEPTSEDGFVDLANLIRSGAFPEIAFALMSCDPTA